MSVGVAPSTTGAFIIPPCCCPGRGPNARYTFRTWWREFGPEPYRTPHVWWTITAEGVGISYTLTLQNEGFPPQSFGNHVDADETDDAGATMEETDVLWRLDVSYDDGEPSDCEWAILPPLN